MGLRDVARRLRSSVDELDAERLQNRFRALDVTPIAELPVRVPVRFGGEIVRLGVGRRAGVSASEVVVTDGTGKVTAVFTGRRAIPGLDHGRAVVLEGVLLDERGRLVTVNPAYTLLPL